MLEEVQFKELVKEVRIEIGSANIEDFKLTDNLFNIMLVGFSFKVRCLNYGKCRYLSVRQC